MLCCGVSEESHEWEGLSWWASRHSPHPVKTELHWLLQAFWSPWQATEQPGCGPRQGKQVKKEQKCQSAHPEKLNLCPSPLIKISYLAGMLKRKEHWDGAGTLLLVPIPSPALSEWEVIAVSTVWSRFWFSAGTGWPKCCPSVSGATCSPCAEPWLPPELTEEPSWASRCSWIIQEERWSKQIEASRSDLGQRHSVTRGEIAAGFLSLTQGY